VGFVAGNEVNNRPPRRVALGVIDDVEVYQQIQQNTRVSRRKSEAQSCYHWVFEIRGLVVDDLMTREFTVTNDSKIKNQMVSINHQCTRQRWVTDNC